MIRIIGPALAVILWASAANADDPIRAPYQETAQQFCTASPCTVVFPAITAETLIVQASCIFILNQSSNALSYVVLYNNPPGSGTHGNYLQIFYEGNFNGTPYYGINTQTYLFASPGQVPRVQVYTDPAYASFVACDLAGYRSSGLPQAAAPSASLPASPALGPLPSPPGLPPSSAGSLPPFARVGAQ